jgi:phytoene desaturase
MQKQPEAVIIGAGVGGLTTAVFLARAGYQVKIFEKNPNPGGRCGKLMRDGHRFDLGATLLLMPSIYREVFNALDINMDTELETQSLDPVYKLFFSDGSVFPFHRNEEKMKENLMAIEPECYPLYQRYIREGYDFFKQAMTGLLNRNFYHVFQFIKPANVALLIRLKTWIIHTNYVKRFFKDHRLQKAFSFQNIYVGQNPYRQPAFFSMLPGAEVHEGALFPKGGMHRIVERLISEARKLGVEIILNEPVEKIIIRKNRATGILLENNREVMADIVIANADLPYIYNQLLPPGLMQQRLKRMEYSCSALVFHWGLKKVYPQLDQHSIFLEDPYKEGMDMIFRDKNISDKPSFYVHSPVRSDKTAAPENEDSLSIIVPIGHLCNKNEDQWTEIKTRTRANIIHRLQEVGLTDIENQIKFEICFTPKTFEQYCHVTKGAVFGSLSHTIFQMGWFRPHNRHIKFKNLYFAGGSTHPGNGIPLVLLSAKLCAERILREQPALKTDGIA